MFTIARFRHGLFEGTRSYPTREAAEAALVGGRRAAAEAVGDDAAVVLLPEWGDRPPPASH